MGNLSLLKQEMFAHGGSVKLTVCQQRPGSKDPQLGASSAPEDFHMPNKLLRGSSPVFAAMLDGPWQESGRNAITIDTFPPDAFREFLDCLLNLGNDTARAGDALVFTPKLIRRVLPIAHYYQVEALKQQIISTAMKILEGCRGKSPFAPEFSAAADLLFAIEANLPESEIPDWKSETLQQVFLFMLQTSNETRFTFLSTYPTLTQSFTTTQVIKYRETHGLKDLSKKTLVKCLETISLRVNRTQPGFADSKVRPVEQVRWRPDSVELCMGPNQSCV